MQEFIWIASTALLHMHDYELDQNKRANSHLVCVVGCPAPAQQLQCLRVVHKRHIADGFTAGRKCTVQQFAACMHMHMQAIRGADGTCGTRASPITRYQLQHQ